MMGSGAGSGLPDGLSGLALMREMLAGAPAAVAYVVLPDLVVEFANDEYRRIVGGRDVVGRPLREVPPDLAPGGLDLVEHVARTGEPIRSHGSEVWIRRSGQETERRFQDVVLQPARDAAGDVAGVVLYAVDVTAHVSDRRPLEELADRLAVTEELYRTLFETLPNGVIHYNADGSILGANPAACEILGYPRDGMTTWPLVQAGRGVHEDGTPFLPAEIPVTVALRTGQIVADVVAGVPHARTGEMRWLRVTAVPDARDDQDRPQRAYAMLTDVTEQRRAEAASLESSRLLARLREANIVGVVVVGEDGGVQEANDAYLDIIGYTRDDLECGRVSWRAITPANWASVDEEALAQLRRTGACRPFEKEYVHRDGHLVPVLIGAAVLDQHPLRWASFVVDLTARQRSEQERAALLAREQAARRDADTARERLAFLLRAGELAAAPNREDLLEQVRQLAEVAVTPGDDDPSLGAHDAPEARQARAALRALNAELDERVSQRMTELVQAEADRRRLEAELRQAERLQTVGQLTSGIAHDFGNLLGVIAGYAEMAEDLGDDLDPELRRILGEIHGAADRAVRLTADLLRFGRRARARPRAIEISALITGIRDLLDVSMDGRAEVLFGPFPATLPAVLADQGQLEQVLLNLAVNARDAMPGGGTLTISARPADFDREDVRQHPGLAPGRYVELDVSDTGIGMTQEIQDRIFERFFTAKSAGTGTGLGLSTVHGIITGAGGAIEVDSQEGDGTTFRIYLPAATSRLHGSGESGRSLNGPAAGAP